MYMRNKRENSGIVIAMSEKSLKIIYYLGRTNFICADSKKFNERMTGGNL